jgi:DNA-binding response OmpR family regulator
VERVAKGGVDAVLLDMSLPDVSGQEVAMRIRNLPPFSDIPLMAVTGHIEPGEEARSLAAGCSAFVTKPVKWKGLLETLRILLQRRTAEAREKGSSALAASDAPDRTQDAPEAGPEAQTGYIDAAVLREAWARRTGLPRERREETAEDPRKAENGKG